MSKISYLYSVRAVVHNCGLQGSTAMESIHMIKRLGGALTDSYLDEGTLHRGVGDVL